nr:EAL domain-containing protein [Methylogaea oryzae]
MAAVYCHRITNKIDELQFYAIHDPLTQLYNRRHFNEILSYEIGRAERHQHTFAVLIIDLDNFKDINDSFGHQTGDSALIGIAETLRASLRNGDLAARIGGDEFAVILPETENDGAEIVGEKICAAISRKKFTACGKHFSITASIGLAAFPNNGNTSESLLASADIAMYKAKSSGKNALYQVKQNEIQDRHILLNNLEEIKLALDQDRIVPFFQPIVASSTGDILGYETLARIIEQDGAIKPAACFIDTIERYGLARRLDYIIVRKSIEALGQHVANGGRLVKLFINLSAQELQGRSVISYADHLCQDFNIPRDCIVFEITERAAIQDIGRMRQFLSRLRNKGFSFALDDFGCGYNSFHYLRDLHFEYVKIDGEFVKNIRRTTIDHALVECLSNLCAKIGTKTIGEYIENADILQEINLLNVDFAQGFYVGLPENGFLYKNVIGAIAA